MNNSIKIVSLLCFTFINFNAWSTACQFANSGATPVVYFGGHNSTDGQANAWASAAQANDRYKPYFKFEGNSIHGAGVQQGDVLGACSSDIKNCVDRINSPSFKGPIVLVGHSDGGWVVNAIAERVKPENRSKIKLVSLDGYAARGPAFADVDVQCWTSYMTEKQKNPVNSCNDISAGARSLYTHEMIGCKPGSCHFLAESGCESAWCAHFRLANNNAPSNVNKSNYGDIGYKNESPPLQFLNGILPQQRSEIPSNTVL